MLAFLACNEPQLGQEYERAIEQWRSDRITRLKAPRGWPSLTGLYWLQEGSNFMGSASGAGIRFPAGMPDTVGSIILEHGAVTQQLNRALEGQVSRDDTLALSEGPVSADGGPYLFGLNSVFWTVLSRGDKFAVRMWDTTHAARQELVSIPHYPVQQKWQVEAQFIEADSGTTIMLDDITGMTRSFDVAGKLHGSHQDTNFTLLALPAGEKELFLIIEDFTTDLETYSGGRYLYIPRPGDGEKTTIDFNKAFLPPCAFTEFATCLLAPEENALQFWVRAGEKNYDHYINGDH